MPNERCNIDLIPETNVIINLKSQILTFVLRGGAGWWGWGYVVVLYDSLVTQKKGKDPKFVPTYRQFLLFFWKERSVPIIRTREKFFKKEEKKEKKGISFFH
ncbi:hypothetical protein VNO77_06723 [Canavalia gladiata]|uniref:Uncharacterized protein n=1 Tax=Canavalia gladiata TaxID=3824 RepID=A0AAN9M8G9_CANGL